MGVGKELRQVSTGLDVGGEGGGLLSWGGL